MINTTITVQALVPDIDIDKIMSDINIYGVSRVRVPVKTFSSDGRLLDVDYVEVEVREGTEEF